MSDNESWSARQTRRWNRYHAWRASLARPAAGFTSQPEPRTIGTFSRGKQLTSGNFLFAGFLVEAPGMSIWDLPMPDDLFEAALHGFTWLDDLAAVGDSAAVSRAQTWTHEWVSRFGRGRGPGWTPDLTGRRLIRWINHAILLLNGQEKKTSEAYFRCLAGQTLFLSRRWKAASPGLPRFEALTGLIYSGLALTGMDRHVAHAVRALDAECAAHVDSGGALSTRNPEELLEIFTLLTWASAALEDAGREIGPAHRAALTAVAPVLRTLRHADGGLARFHGGGRGLEGRLDRSLATAGVRATPNTGLAMGYARLSHGRTTVIVDAAPPPVPDASANAHASTLAFEVTSGRRPMIVNCGSGATFGKSWHRAGRATPSHTTLGIEGYSSSRLGVGSRISDRPSDLLTDGPREVRFDRHEADAGTRLIVGHDGYVPSHGLTHIRTLHLSYDGRALTGEDSLLALDRAAERRFDVVYQRTRMQGIPYAIRFHLHPDVDATLAEDEASVRLTLKSGEAWTFRFTGELRIGLEQSVYLEKTRLSPRGSNQIVLAGQARDYTTRVGWSLAKADTTPDVLRDYEMDDLMAVD